MKPTFKTTALAILVSLGAVACSSNSSHDGAQPVKVTKPAEATKPVEATKFDFKKEATLESGKEWRYIDFSVPDTGVGSQEDGISRYHNIGGSGVLNFNKLSKYSTSEFIGVANDETYVLRNKVAKNGVHYHFINQPYSTYGFISDGEGLDDPFNNVSEGFHLIPHSYNAKDPVDGVYSGNVIAKIVNKDLKYIIKNDGKVTLNVKTNSDANDKVMLSGSINSNTVGEIKLLPGELKFGWASGSAVLQDITGGYHTTFSSNQKEVVDSVSINKIDEKTNLKVNIEGKDSPISYYDAVFGGQRQ